LAALQVLGARLPLPPGPRTVEARASRRRGQPLTSQIVRHWATPWLSGIGTRRIDWEPDRPFPAARRRQWADGARARDAVGQVPPGLRRGDWPRLGPRGPRSPTDHSTRDAVPGEP